MPGRVRSLLGALCLAMAACALRVSETGFDIAWASLVRQALIALGLGVLLVFYARREGSAQLRLALEAALWAIALSSLFNFPMFWLSSGGGLADASLSRADAALGLHVPTLVHWVRARLWLDASLTTLYESLRPVSVLAILLPALAGRVEDTARVLLALALSALVSLLVLSRLHAVGPWLGGEFSANAAQLECAALLQRIAQGAPVTIDVSRSAPLIAFPSWHALLAVLSAAALSRFRLVSWLAAPWASLVALSTLSTGWHYAVDTLAGVALGLATYAAAHWLLQNRKESLHDQSNAPLPGLGLLHDAILRGAAVPRGHRDHRLVAEDAAPIPGRDA